jgi:hypothetical protein
VRGKLCFRRNDKLKIKQDDLIGSIFQMAKLIRNCSFSNEIRWICQGKRGSPLPPSPVSWIPAIEYKA